MTATQIYLVSAYAAALAGKPCTENAAGVDFEKLYRLALTQGIAGTVYYSLREVSMPAEVAARFEEAHNKALLWDLTREEEEKRVFAAFDKGDINYLPLKGSVMRSYYPSTDMRVMGDTDIMIEGYARRDARKLMEGLGYRFADSHSGHDIYKHENGSVFEVHWKPEDASEFHKKLMERAVPSANGACRLSLNLNDFYLYMVSHLARHVRTSGAGLRMLADVKVFYSRCGLKIDGKYVAEVLEELGLTTFEKQLKKLLHTLFYAAPADELTKGFAEYIMSGGVFGSLENKNANKRGDKSKAGYFISSVFPSYGDMKKRYGFLKYLPFLLPVMWVVRWFSLLFRGKKPKDRFKQGAAIDSKRLKSNKQLLDRLGLSNLKNGKPRMSVGDIIGCLMGIAVLAVATYYIGKSFYMGDNARPPMTVDESEESEELSEVAGGDEESTIVIPERDYGTIAFREGIYTGDLVDGMPDGLGKLVLNSGESYSGGFSEGEFNGKGVYKYNDGTSFDGMWFEGEINGEGTWHFADGSFIYGEFIDGEPWGVCLYECANGDMYEGTLKNGKWHGNGKFVWISGDTYEGEFVDGIRQGQGKYQYCGGDTYEGEWIDNSPNGYGTSTVSGSTFKGLFVEGVIEGEGSAVLAGGDTYKGYFVHGVFNDDEAVYTFAGGGKYEGGFENGVFHGEGTLTYKDGDIVKGTFENGLLQGKAKYYYSNADVWKTITYVDGKPQ